MFVWRFERDVSHSLGHLNTCLPVGGTVWGVALLEEHVSRGGFGVHSLPALSDVCLQFNMSLRFLSLLPRLPVLINYYLSGT